MQIIERLNIALVVPGFSASETDWCIPALLNFVRHLASQHDVSVYTLRYPHERRLYNVSGARVRSFGGATVRGLRRLPLLARAIAAIVADARQKPYSVIHGLWADEAGLVAAVAARRCGVPALVSLMGGELARIPELRYGVQLSHIGRLSTALSLRLASGVSAGSRLFAAQAAKRYSADRLHTLPLGVDLSHFRPLPAGAQPPGWRLVHAASLVPVKDQITLLRAFARARMQLPAANLSLHIAGDGPLRAALAGEAQRLGVGSHVQFAGAVPHECMPDFYRQGRLFILSSHHESQNLALLEAAACGIPAVGTKVGLLPELLMPDALAETGDVLGLAQCIATMVRNEEIRQDDARRLRKLVEIQFGLDKATARFVAVYQQLVQTKTM